MEEEFRVETISYILVVTTVPVEAFQMGLVSNGSKVTAGPRAAVLKPFWQKMVELRPTSPAELWILNCNRKTSQGHSLKKVGEVRTWEATQSVQVEHAYANASLVTA